MEKIVVLPPFGKKYKKYAECFLKKFQIEKFIKIFLGKSQIFSFSFSSFCRLSEQKHNKYKSFLSPYSIKYFNHDIDALLLINFSNKCRTKNQNKMITNIILYWKSRFFRLFRYLSEYYESISDIF